MIKTAMFLTATFVDPEGDGSYNHLLEHYDINTDRHYMAAFSYEKDIGIRPGEQFLAGVDMECEKIYALDGPGAPVTARNTLICNINSMTIGNTVYKALIHQPTKEQP